jgi:hypothetical protein
MAHQFPIDLAFPADFIVREIEQTPLGALVHRLGIQRGATSHWVVEIVGQRQKWMGLVGLEPPPVRGAMTGIFSTPHPSRFCLLASGKATLVDVDDPSVSNPLGVYPVVAVRAVKADGLLLLATPQIVGALDQGGLAWRTDRLAIDSLRMDEVNQGRLAGVSDPDGDDLARDFVVDLQTGEHEGGSEVV